MAKEEKLIKVHFKGSICGESLWAKPGKNNTAELRNIPFNQEISLHDIVKIDEDGEIVKIVKKKTITCGVRYKYTEKNVRKEYHSMAKYFEKNKIKVEGVSFGIASLALPLKMKKRTFINIVKKSPVKIINYYSSNLVK